MPTVTDAYKKVPLMFQAQIQGRCQLQRIHSDRTKNGEKQDVEIWTEQWTEKCETKIPEFPQAINSNSQEYQISWRFVTNGGQDDGIIRPVIGARGIPFYPGSSMKGAFRQACKTEAPGKVEEYCGSAEKPGVLRFHGGYPTDNSWQENLVDLVHPQQKWQVQTKDTRSKPKGESAFALISLYKPKLKFGISSTKTLKEWDEIWKIWEKALGSGLGCRVSAGYGQPTQQEGKVIYEAFIQGQGMAATVIGGESEFRPNMFKASLRCHALRLFGGLTSDDNAELLAENLFGGVKRNGGTFGLLAMNWKNVFEPIIKPFEPGYNEPRYEAKGVLQWIQTQSLPQDKAKSLLKLIKVLMRFSMLLGGYGKSWRRIDHSLFYEQYYGTRERKPLIGCHWHWRNESLNKYNLVISPKQVTGFLNNAQTVVKEWMELSGITPSRSGANWREAWHKDNVQVWGRVAKDKDDSRAISWFHGHYRPAIREINQRESSIYHTNITGSMNQISRIWHRMYPLPKQMRNRKTEEIELRYPPPVKQSYLELLTIFPDASSVSKDFIDFLSSPQTDFVHLW